MKLDEFKIKLEEAMNRFRSVAISNLGKLNCEYEDRLGDKCDRRAFIYHLDSQKFRCIDHVSEP